MGLSSVVTVLALVVAVSASVVDNRLDGGERVVLVAPVLAPPRDSRTQATDRSRQFPILILLAQQDRSENARSEADAKSLETNPRPIYVQKLADQENAAPILNRQKRTLKKFYKGGGGGGYVGVQPVYYQPAYQPAYQPVYHQAQPTYQEPTKIYITVEKGGHGGGGKSYGHQQPVYYQQQQPQTNYQVVPVSHGCGGGCGGGGGGGYSQSSSFAVAGASSSSGSYGKR